MGEEQLFFKKREKRKNWQTWRLIGKTNLRKIAHANIEELMHTLESRHVTRVNTYTPR